MSAIAAAFHPAAPAWDEQELPARTAGLRSLSLMVGGAGIVASLVLALVAPKALFPAYLTAYVLFTGLGVGSLGLLLLHHLVGGMWGFVIRRPLEAASMTLPLMALLFLPLVLGMRTLYEWADPEAVKEHAALGLKAGYLNVPFFLVRAALYHAIWSGLALLIRSGSVRQDATEDPAPTNRNVTLAAPGLVLVFVSVTFAAIDWMMSIEPEWYSSIYGVMVMVGWALTSLSTAVIVASLLSRVRPLSEVATPNAFNDLGNLMLAFTMLWAYMSFSQYLIIWSGNLAEEVPWYIKRSLGAWRGVCLFLMVFHFFVPFFCLLMRENKRYASRLWMIGAWLLVMQVVNDAWLIIPAFPSYQWAQLLALIPTLAGVGGLWLWAYTTQLSRRSLLPRHDPLLEEALHHHGAGGHAES